MKRMKLLFEQYVMITAGIVLGIALEAVICRLDGTELQFMWHMPLSIVVAGVLGALPTLLLVDADAVRVDYSFWRVILHFFLVFIAIALVGILFAWFGDLRSFLFFTVIFACVYAFVWGGTTLICMHDARIINNALRARDSAPDNDDDEPPVALE